MVGSAVVIVGELLGALDGALEGLVVGEVLGELVAFVEREDQDANSKEDKEVV